MVELNVVPLVTNYSSQVCGVRCIARFQLTTCTVAPYMAYCTHRPALVDFRG